MAYEFIKSKYSEPAAILSYKDGEIRILDINDRFIPEMWMNISNEEFLAREYEENFETDNFKVFAAAVKKCADLGEERTVETERKLFSECCGFSSIFLKSRLALVEKTEDGAIIFEGIRNVTEEQNMKADLKDIEYRYKQASEQINIYNWEYNIETKEMRPCYRCMRDLGLPAVVKNYPEPAIEAGIFPPDYADMYRDLMKKIDEGIGEAEADIPLTVGRVPFRIKYSTEFDENGRPVKAFGSATLISETELGKIKVDNQIISKLAEEYRCIYLADFVKNEAKIVKQDGLIELKAGADCNDLAKLITSKLKDVDEERRRLLDDVNSLRLDLFRNCEQREFVYKDDESDKWIRIVYHVIERTGDKVDRLLLTASVIDDLRGQKMDADRMIASQQKMLLSAIDEANRANRAKTEFFSNMSHDIRTPMNAITGFSRLAAEEIDNRENLEDYLDKIVSAGDHLMSLINDILDMSRIESGKMEISTSPVKIKDLLLQSADMVRVKMDENKLNFTVNVDEIGEDTVECDKLRFNQVLLNLLSNAYKYTPEGGKVFLTGKLLEKKDVLTYEIHVRDTGIGMSEEFREHIWEAYSREETKAVHEIQGTGLGMVIVQNIVNLMQGTIELDSEPGKGSEFIIKLPLKPVSGEADVSASDEAVNEALNKNYEGVTVLVVDDTSANLKLAERILTKFGFTVLRSESGVDALDRVKASKPGDIDLILMDVKMPVMDGLEATRRIRALEDPALANIPIIAMTANAFASDIQDTFDAGMNEHVSKPFLKEELITKINANLK